MNLNVKYSSKMNIKHLFFLNIFCSNKHIYAQIKNIKLNKIIITSSTINQFKFNNKQIAYKIGEDLAKKALNQNIKFAYFYRGLNKYHGKIKSLIKGARKYGLYC